jgi:hypothetical protein
MNRFSAMLIPDVGDAISTKRSPTMMIAQARALCEARLLLRDLAVQRIEVVLLEGEHALAGCSQIIRRVAENNLR